MGLFDAFTGKPAKEAAERNRALIQANKLEGLGYLDTGKTEGVNYLQSGMDEGLGYLDQAGKAFAPLSSLGEKYGGATTMLLNAQGVNGQAGIDAAKGAFQAGPGYGFAMDQGMEALNRRRAAGGMLNSGNADVDAMTFGQGLANQEFNNWRNNFSQFINPELQATQGATQGVANALAGQAGVAQGGYTNMANLTQNDATNRVNLANTTTSGLANTNTQEANAKMQASGNLLGGIGSLLSLGTSMFGGGGLFSAGGLFGK